MQLTKFLNQCAVTHECFDLFFKFILVITLITEIETNENSGN